MQISIFGMGYVGAVCAACLTDYGHEVIGVDVSALKVKLINSGQSPIVEPGLGELLAKGVASGKLRATTDTEEAILGSELTMICVGTPSKRNGDLDLRYVDQVCREIGAILKNKAARHTVVVRSTVLPGTVKNVVIPALEQSSGKKAGTDFGVAVNPEFLRESTAIDDYREPPMTIIGELDAASGEGLASIYSVLPAAVFRRPIEVAEMVKYTCNVWHATKVTFANEIGNIAKACGVDGREVMKLICEDDKLNLSAYYMKPGFAFGGSCLPKDLRALNYRSSQVESDNPMLAAIMRSNTTHVERAFNLVASFGKKNVGLLGLAFKSGTDDLRESPLVDLAELLIGKGYSLKIFDRNVDHARVMGTNKDYIDSKIPHVSKLLHSSLDEVVGSSEVIVLGNKDSEFAEVIAKLKPGIKIVDLVGFMKSTSTEDAQGICW